MPEEMMEQTQEMEQENNYEPENNQYYDDQDYDTDSEVTIFGMNPKTFVKVVGGAMAAGAVVKGVVDKTVAKVKAKSGVGIKKKWVVRSPITRVPVDVEVNGKSVTDPKPADPEPKSPENPEADNKANS